MTIMSLVFHFLSYHFDISLKLNYNGFFYFYLIVKQCLNVIQISLACDLFFIEQKYMVLLHLLCNKTAWPAMFSYNLKNVAKCNCLTGSCYTERIQGLGEIFKMINQIGYIFIQSKADN